MGNSYIMRALLLACVACLADHGHSQTIPSTYKEFKASIPEGIPRMDDMGGMPDMSQVTGEMPAEALKDENAFRDHLEDKFALPDMTNPVAMQLTDLTFHDVIKSNPYVAVMFVRPDRNLNGLMMHWERLANIMEDLPAYVNANITIATIDISLPEHEKIAKEFGLEDKRVGFKLFKDGQFFLNITSQQHSDAWKTFLLNRVLPSYVHLTNEKELVRWKRRRNVGVADVKMLAFFEESDSEKIERFVNVAKDLRDYGRFAYVTEKSLFLRATKLKAEEPGEKIEEVENGNVALLKSFDLSVMRYHGEINSDAVFNFLHEHRVRLLTNINSQDDHEIDNYFEHRSTKVLLFLRNATDFQMYLPDMLSFAAAYRKKGFVVGYQLHSDGEFSFNHFNVDETPTALIVEMQKDRRYYNTDRKCLRYESLKQFVTDYQDGKLEPVLVSEEVPAKQTGPVTYIVGKSYETVVAQNKEQDVVMAFFAPECPDCFVLYDILEKFAKVMRRETSRVLVATTNGLANDIMGVDVQWYPQLFFLSAKDKQEGNTLVNTTIPTSYWSLEGLVNYMREHTSHNDLVVDEEILEMYKPKEPQVDQGGANGEKSTEGAENMIDLDAEEFDQPEVVSTKEESVSEGLSEVEPSVGEERTEEDDGQCMEETTCKGDLTDKGPAEADVKVDKTVETPKSTEKPRSRLSPDELEEKVATMDARMTEIAAMNEVEATPKKLSESEQQMERLRERGQRAGISEPGSVPERIDVDNDEETMLFENELALAKKLGIPGVEQIVSARKNAKVKYPKEPEPEKQETTDSQRENMEDSMFGPAGGMLEKYVDDFDVEEFVRQMTWEKSWLFRSLMLVQLFTGDNAYFVMIFAALTIVLMSVLRRLLARRRRRLTRSWLVSFFEEHNPEKVGSVEVILDTYLSLKNGEKRLKEDLVKKYLSGAGAKADSKKDK